MASVNFEKLKSKQQVKQMFRHCDKTERQKSEHNNKQINKNLSGTNQQYKRGYEETCRLFDDRLDYLDSLDGQNKRKDRVICFGLEIPFPDGLKASDEVKWINEVNKIMQARYGKENIMNGYVHRDEKHEYIDAETGAKRESRNHMHYYVIPAMEDGMLNGKQFSSRKNIKSLNQEIHTMTQERFGIDFMDGTKKKSKATVETLKQKSLIAEEVAKQVEVEKERLEALYAKKQREFEDRLIQEYNKLLVQEQEKLQDDFQHKEDALQAQFDIRVSEEVERRVGRRKYETAAYQDDRRKNRELPSIGFSLDE